MYVSARAQDGNEIPSVLPMSYESSYLIRIFAMVNDQLRGCWLWKTQDGSLQTKNTYYSART